MREMNGAPDRGALGTEPLAASVWSPAHGTVPVMESIPFEWPAWARELGLGSYCAEYPADAAAEGAWREWGWTWPEHLWGGAPQTAPAPWAACASFDSFCTWRQAGDTAHRSRVLHYCGYPAWRWDGAWREMNEGSDDCEITAQQGRVWFRCTRCNDIFVATNSLRANGGAAAAARRD